MRIFSKPCEHQQHHANTDENGNNGFSLIELIIVILILGIISMIAIPNLLAARRAANEAAAISNSRMVFSAQNAFKVSSATRDFGTFAQLHAAGFIDTSIGPPPGSKSGYYFEMSVQAATPATPARFDLRTRPLSHSLVMPLQATGSRDFGICDTGIIFQTVDNTPVTFDPVTRAVQGTAVPLGAS